MSEYINSYIKRMDALDAINERREAAQSRGDDLVAYTANLDFLDVSNLPSADVAEVVRCKDCKYWKSNTEFCEFWSALNVAQRTCKNDYCSYGEIKEQEHE